MIKEADPEELSNVSSVLLSLAPDGEHDTAGLQRTLRMCVDKQEDVAVNM